LKIKLERRWKTTKEEEDLLGVKNSEKSVKRDETSGHK
jgi:hypothetical protein